MIKISNLEIQYNIMLTYVKKNCLIILKWSKINIQIFFLVIFGANYIRLPRVPINKQIHIINIFLKIRSPKNGITQSSELHILHYFGSG